jgi:organic radical activating enzyme
MRASAIIPAWGRILQGYRPFLSIEITKECPLRCPGCYAYGRGHLNNGHDLRALIDRRGAELIEGVLSLVRRFRPLHVSLVGGEPLIRYRELTPLIRRLNAMGIEVQVVTSAYRPIPQEWMELPNLHLVVSVDGLKPEHDIRRAPATYDRILKNTAGHTIIVHCTIIPQFLSHQDYLREFVQTWSLQQNVRKIWFSLFTPQKGEDTPERLTASERTLAIDRIAALCSLYPKLHAPSLVLDGYRHPPVSPSQCIFAQVTRCISSDLSTPVVPCQIGGQPVCSECGCLAAAGLASLGKIRLAGLFRVSDVFLLSKRLGDRLKDRNHHSPLE